MTLRKAGRLGAANPVAGTQPRGFVPKGTSASEMAGFIERVSTSEPSARTRLGLTSPDNMSEAAYCEQKPPIA